MKFALRLLADLSFYFTYATVLASITGRFVSHLVWLVPAAGYVLYACITYRRYTADVNYNFVFRLYTRVFVLLFFVFSLIIADLRIYPIVFMWFGMLFFASSVTLMRLTRNDEYLQKKAVYRLISLIPVLAVFAVAAVGAALWQTGLLPTMVSAIYVSILAPAVILVLRFLAFITGPVGEALLRRFAGREIEFVEPEEWAVGGGDPYDFGDYGFPEDLGFNAPQTVLLITVIVVLVGGAVYVMYRIIRNLTHRIGTAQAGIEHIPLEPENIRRISKPKSRLRRIYTRFLARCKENDIICEKHMTSDDYRRLAGGVFGMHEEMARLRDVYLPERYSDNPNTQKADIEFAQKLVKRLKRR